MVLTDEMKAVVILHPSGHLVPSLILLIGIKRCLL
jgi:hypothetical protein